MNTYKRLLTYVYPYWWAFLLVMLGFAINAGGEVYGAELIKNITDAINNNNREQLKWLPLMLIGLFFFKGIGSFLGGYFSAVIARNMVHTLRVEAFEHVLALPNQYFLSHSGGKISSKLIYDVEQVTAAGTDALRSLLREGFIVLGLLGFLFYTNWKLSLILLCLLPVQGLLIRYASKRFRRFSKNVQESMGAVSHIVGEVIGGVDVVKNFGGVTTEQRRFEAASKDNLTQSLKMAATSAINVPAIQLVIAVAMAAVLYVALKPEVLGNSTAGEFIAYITACIMLSKPIRELTMVNEKIQRGLAAAESLFSLIDAPKEVDTGTEKPVLSGAIRFEQVSLNYGDTNALDNFSLNIYAGETVAFVGRSGAGKTSLINLLLRSHELSGGSILFGCTNAHNNANSNVHNNANTNSNNIQQDKFVSIKDIQRVCLRTQIASVSQKVVLFDATIAQNIAYGELENSNEKEILLAAKAAHADEFIQKLPDIYQTRVGTDGLSLSGGQRQRIAIARALLKDAPILILDEATSALDNESEHHIQQALENAMQGRTTLVIAHRLSTIENADRIVVMDKGRIIEQGSHSELLAKNGLYASMHARDFEDLQ